MADDNKPLAVIFDLDGVLFNASIFKSKDWDKHPDETLTHKQFDAKWKEFYSHIPDFEPIRPMIDVNFGLSLRYPIIIMTGRPMAFRLETITGLELNGIKWEKLLMRENDDRRSAHKIKRDMLENSVFPTWKPILAFENNQETIEMYTEKGILTYAPMHKLIKKM